MKVWITKYALSKGIQEREAVKLTAAEGEPMVRIEEEGFAYYLCRPHWWPTKESAILRAEQMRNAKIKSLEKQVDKLKKLKFEI